LGARLAAASHRPAALCKLAAAYVVSVAVVARIIARRRGRRNRLEDRELLKPPRSAVLDGGATCVYTEAAGIVV
jgi:hypothetical protein